MDSPTRTKTAQAAVILLVLVVLGIVGVAFRGSWGAFRDAALACHFDHASASLYPFAVDGLMVVAILAAVLLRHDRGARAYCLSIIGSYTGASLLVNFLHGLGMFAIDPATGTRPVPPWQVVAVIALLVVGSIFLGSHLLVYVWRHVFPDAATGEGMAVVVECGHQVATTLEDAAVAAVLAGLSQRRASEEFGISRDRLSAAIRRVREVAGPVAAPELAAAPESA